MTHITLKNKDKGHVPYEAKGFRSGFVILFAVTISSIILAIALGVANIALKEVKFSTDARETNNAFFAADTGIECALFNDKSTSNSFVGDGSGTVQCLGGNIFLNEPSSSSWDFVIPGLGSAGQGCAQVSVTKVGSSPVVTTIISKGYNVGDIISCLSSDSNRIERELLVSY